MQFSSTSLVGGHRSIFIKLKIEQDWSGTVSIVSPIQEQVNDDIILNTSGLTFGERSLLTDEPVSRDVVANGRNQMILHFDVSARIN